MGQVAWIKGIIIIIIIIAINRAQILTPSCYWEFHRKTQ